MFPNYFCKGGKAGKKSLSTLNLFIYVFKLEEYAILFVWVYYKQIAEWYLFASLYNGLCKPTGVRTHMREARADSKLLQSWAYSSPHHQARSEQRKEV